jgi:hypothetical protein
MALLQTAQRVFVVPRHAQQIQDYIVTSQATPAVLFHHALRPMALLQTTQRANVVLHRALQIQVCIVMNYSMHAVHSRHVKLTTVRFQTMPHARVLPLGVMPTTFVMQR